MMLNYRAAGYSHERSSANRRCLQSRLAKSVVSSEVELAGRFAAKGRVLEQYRMLSVGRCQTFGQDGSCTVSAEISDCRRFFESPRNGPEYVKRLPIQIENYFNRLQPRFRSA